MVNENERRRREAAKAHEQQADALEKMRKLWAEGVGDIYIDNGVQKQYIGTTQGSSTNGITMSSGQAWQTPRKWTATTVGEDATKVFADAIEQMRRLGISTEDAAKRLNTLTGLTKDNGHRKKCAYIHGLMGHPCSCQPPTLWGQVLLWHCECCDTPSAPMRYGLCDLCRSHEYAPVEQVRVDHEVERDV